MEHPPDSDDRAADLAHAIRRRRRRTMGTGAALCAAGAVAMLALALQMTDIGHASGFAVAGLALAVGAAVVGWHAFH